MCDVTPVVDAASGAPGADYTAAGVSGDVTIVLAAC